jgi:hypothetical protein
MLPYGEAKFPDSSLIDLWSVAAGADPIVPGKFEVLHFTYGCCIVGLADGTVYVMVAVVQRRILKNIFNLCKCPFFLPVGCRKKLTFCDWFSNISTVK